MVQNKQRLVIVDCDVFNSCMMMAAGHNDNILFKVCRLSDGVAATHRQEMANPIGPSRVRHHRIVRVPEVMRVIEVADSRCAPIITPWGQKTKP